MHSSLSTSTDKGFRTLIARCNRCLQCNKAWCFRQLPAGQLLVEHVGECGGPLNLQKVKQFNARQFASQFTPGRSLVEMHSQQVPVEERPSVNQLRNRRPSKRGRSDKHAPVQCLGDAQRFLEEPPAGIQLLREQSIASGETVSILFTIPGVEDLLGDFQLTGCLLDWTYQTNSDGLLLGCVGPIGLQMTDQGPSMRLLPVYFALSSTENEDATRKLLKVYLDKMKGLGCEVEDLFADCSVIQAALSMQRDGEYDRLFLHRCLQHVKNNVSQAAAKRDETSGKARLSNKELLQPILDWITFSATLPSDVEFDTMWRSILDRMASNSSATDFAEGAMAAYLRKNLLDDAGAWGVCNMSSVFSTCLSP